MARPQKTGIDYYYFDCDFFENRKVRKIMRGCGVQSVAILSCLLCTIYKKGYYITWDHEESTFDIADKIGVSDGAVSELVKKAIEADFFSRKMFEKHKILTSAAIQEIFFDACKRREVIHYSKMYLLIDVSEYKNAVNVDRNPVNASGGTQSKVEEIKEEESKVDNEESGASAPPPPTSFKKFSEEDFKESIRAANAGLSPPLPGTELHKFFGYWGEKSASGRMKFQLEKTWDTKRRLETWRENMGKFERNGKNNFGGTARPVPTATAISETGFGKL